MALDGLVAVGGDLSVQRLLLAYRKGIFPWYNAGDPILWWSPDPRMVFTPESFHVSRRLKRTLRNGAYRVTMDTAFTEVIHACATVPRPGQGGTWITAEMESAYIELHHAGYAHSIEAWRDGELAGAVYGVSLGAAFFGESMFSRRSDASKVALAAAMAQFEKWEVRLVDCQVANAHLARLGAYEVPRHAFLRMLERALRVPTRRGPWGLEASVLSVDGVSGSPKRVTLTERQSAARPRRKPDEKEVWP